MFRSVFAACILMASASLAQTAQPSPLDGIWLGTLHTGGPDLRLQLHLHQNASGQWACLADSLDQHAMGIPCTVTSAVNPIVIDVPAARGRFTGSLAGDTLDGTWSQGSPLPLTFQRQATALQPAPAPPPAAPDAALPPATLDNLQSILDRDLAAALKSGALAPSTKTGITIGVIQNGVRRIFTYGPAKPDSLFEIGSITKTFTATILAQMVEQHKVRLDEPVRDLLPPGTVAKPATTPNPNLTESHSSLSITPDNFLPAGPEITLLDLSDQHSGLPRMPDNFHPADPANPYADYGAKDLYAYIAKHGVALPANAPFGYSNLGVGLLGQALANRAQMSYPDLLHAQVTGPLGMNDTVIAIPPALRARFIQGHTAAHAPAHAWDLDALAGAGAIRSTAADMLTFLEAQLHPGHLPPSALASPNGKTLPAAIAATHILHAEVSEGMHIALNWLHYDDTGSFWHNGGTGGFSSYALFNPAKDFAVIVLSNTAPDGFTDKLGMHIAQRLEGRPAISLAPISHSGVPQ
jgi:D-alanyl-D-alanine-carboxypeptidase/D-alanyl-D-alanine-endopeptidase